MGEAKVQAVFAVEALNDEAHQAGLTLPRSIR
jgi:hypothetical protein